MATLEEYLASHDCKPQFKPMPVYFVDGDFIAWYWKDERAYAESHHVDNVWWATFERSMANHELVGVKINGIRQIAAKLIAEEVAKERERCAKIADRYGTDCMSRGWFPEAALARLIADAIRKEPAR